MKHLKQPQTNTNVISSNKNNSNILSQYPENKRLIDLCTQKLNKEPFHKKALMLRTSTYIKDNQLDKAEKDARQLLIVDPNNSAGYFLLGCIYEKKERLEESVEYLTKAIEIELPVQYPINYDIFEIKANGMAYAVSEKAAEIYDFTDLYLNLTLD